MAYTVSLAELLRAGFVPAPDEVVAIADALIHQPPDDPPRPPFGPLAAERVCISSDGAVVSCAGCAATPTVAELAILMQDLLAATPHVPGGLRYAIARALHEVDAPPFDSLDEFATTIQRYAPHRREDVLRRLIARHDRRRPAPSASDLRQQLREADRRFYEAQTRDDSASRVDPRSRSWIVGLLVAGALTTIAAASVVGDRTIALPPVQSPPAAAVEPTIVAPLASDEAHAVIAPRAPQRPRARSPRPVRDAHVDAHVPPDTHVRGIRLRWLHKTIAIKDDFAKP